MGQILSLTEELARWRNWAVQASREENGWESEAPNWALLIRAAKSALIDGENTQEETEIAAVFGISEEAEELADFLKSNLNCVPSERIRRLLASEDSKVRWQIYDSFEPKGSWREMLIEGIDDPDDYVRRRAFLRLLTSSELPRGLLEAALEDSDSVVRTEAAVRLGRQST